MAEFAGTPAGQERRFAVIASRFNQTIVERLVDGALDALVRHGVRADDVDVVWVPGAWELPIAARRLLATERYDALVAVGAVIRGDTPHFDYVAAEAAKGIAHASFETGVPVAEQKFTQAELWVTRYHDNEYPKETRRLAEALPSYLNEEPVDGVNVVVWYVLHVHHIARTEDWPAMPIEWVGFMLRPRDFLDTSPIQAEP